MLLVQVIVGRRHQQPAMILRVDLQNILGRKDTIPAELKGALCGAGSWTPETEMAEPGLPFAPYDEKEILSSSRSEPVFATRGTLLGSTESNEDTIIPSRRLWAWRRLAASYQQPPPNSAETWHRQHSSFQLLPVVPSNPDTLGSLWFALCKHHRPRTLSL